MLAFSFFTITLVHVVCGTPIASPPNSSVKPPHVARQLPIAGLVALAEGIYLDITTEGIVGDLLGDYVSAVGAAFGAFTGLPFNDKDNCIMTISAYGGGHCSVVSQPAQQSGTTQQTVHDPNENPWEVCWWNSTANVSGKRYFNDPGVGQYMIEWMSKDGSASADAAQGDGEGCPQAGICDPAITFFRDGYNIILYAYETLYQCDDYHLGAPSLCYGGDVNQFHIGGAQYSYK